MHNTSKHVFEAKLSNDSNLDEFFRGNMVVVRTEFFRSYDVQRDLEEIIIPDLLSTSNKRTQLMKIWSAGCSDGREPYSIAAIIHRWMQEHNLYRSINFHASDINPDMIKTAKSGVYQFKEKDKNRISGWEKYFKVVNSNIMVDSVLTNQVKFYNENIFYSQVKEQQDIIICTNVLLYYDPEFRKTIVKKLCQKLKSGGYLYLESLGRRFMSSVGIERLSSNSHFFKKD